MIRLLLCQNSRVALCAFICIGFGLLSRSLAQRDNAEANILPLSPAPAAGVVVQRALPSTIDWEGREYQPSEAIELLMRVVTGDRTDPKERASALLELAAFAPSLQGTPRIPELTALYEKLTQQDEKRALIGCIAESDDKRGLPLFAKVLSHTTDEVARFQAAYALARWNVRQGIRGLIELLNSRTLGLEGQRFADEVLKVLQFLNIQKGWGRPDQVILEKITQSEAGLTQDQKLGLYTEEIKSWFVANEHRFPDWKAGDPLPEVPADEEQAPADTKE